MARTEETQREMDAACLHWIRVGMEHHETLAALRACNEKTLKAVLIRASRDAARARKAQALSPNQRRGLMCIGALDVIAQERRAAADG